MNLVPFVCQLCSSQIFMIHSLSCTCKHCSAFGLFLFHLQQPEV
ncbi:Nuclear receptor domain-containing protein [Caenorhabditis elegans]|uniref:Nuclear receptor domain-containing protein n=1 Tax=Caenorhabditis elegans TaxID=6239 RepID=D1YSH4_CAEEL|nr:Nuclear receptor domain-containing protein [Caenorhabditis elegans]CCD62962.1 Nuclear receptor domain-containing protein [Caenorhabditis elegans]|eukprot:NP_001256022.1 Uncharacterized protein CELE_C17B7.14 [Caenorhabditis elegans]